jgi:hypothetical protein
MARRPVVVVKDEFVVRQSPCIKDECLEAEEYPLLGAPIFAEVIYGVCRFMKLLYLPVVTSYKGSVNPVTNPNPVSTTTAQFCNCNFS